MTRMSNVVVVEDEVYLADAIAAALTAHGRNTRVAYDGAAALELLEDADVVVLDRDLPRVHGDEVCARIRTEHPHIRVLMLTAASALDDKTAALAYLAVMAAARLDSGLPFHVKMAKMHGATRDEVISAVLIGLPAVGNVVTASLPAVLEAYDEE